MRDLKFRAWDKTSNSMRFFNGIFNNAPFTEKSSFPQYESCPELNDITIMQSIGLIDKNCKDIYEGDLVLIKETRICEVIFHQLAGCWDLVARNIISSEDIQSVSPASYQYHAEILGNIHENPELLEDRQ